MLTVDKSIGMIKKPNRSIDFMKGILTILVVIGHSLSGNLREVFPRYMIYSFNMPALNFPRGSRELEKCF